MKMTAFEMRVLNWIAANEKWDAEKCAADLGIGAKSAKTGKSKLRQLGLVEAIERPTAAGELVMKS